MSILSKIFSSGATELVKGVGGVIDNLHTSKAEKLEAKQKMQELISSYEVQMEKEISSRWSADMQSDSWLSKNVRPAVLIFLVVSTVLMIFIDAGMIDFEVKASWVDLLQLVLITVIGAYFGGRSLKKLRKMAKQAAFVYRANAQKKRPGIHAKSKSSKSKGSKNYVKAYRGQGR